MNTRIPTTLRTLVLVLFVCDAFWISCVYCQVVNSRGEIACRVMESFKDDRLGVTVIVFHQRDKADGPRLGAMLLSHSGQAMEIVLAGGRSHRVTVFRVKSCFGRGLLLLPAPAKLDEGGEFVLKLLPSHF